MSRTHEMELSCEQTIRSRGVCEPALEPRGEWEGSQTRGQDFKPDLGNSAVRHYRGAFENVAMVEMRTQLAIERAGLVTLHLQLARRSSIPTQHFGVETFADVLKSGLRYDLQQAIKAIPGQSSGLSYAYFLILAGNQDGVKADRMVTRFVANALGVRNVTPELAEELVRNASTVLRAEFPRLVPSSLDNKIWKYRRAREDGGPSNCRP